jgi:predicted metal-dependent hydrolase
VECGAPLSGASTELERGRVLFNAGRYFEAHEAWEEAWRAESGPRRRALQGLIQVAAGYHKAFAQRQAGGCVRLLGAGLEKLRPAAAASPDGDLAAFLRKVENDLREARRWTRGEVGGLQAVPRLEGAALGDI